MPLLTPRSIGNIDGSYPGTPIKVEQDESNPLAIRVKRLATGAKELFDKESLANAGVLTVENAHNAQDAVRGVDIDPSNIGKNELERMLALEANSEGHIEDWQ